MRESKIILIFSVFWIFLSCRVSSVPVIYYEERYSNKSMEQKKDIDSYMEAFPSKYRLDVLRERNEKVIIFHGESFKNDTVIINRDTLSFTKINDQCTGSKAYIISSKKKSIKINSYGSKNRERLILKLRKEYDYVEISGGKNWDITYSDYFLIRTCY